MKNKQEHAQLLAEALDQVDDSMLQQAMEVDTAEKFHTLDGNMKKVRFAKDRPVATFHRVAAIAACLAVALTITFGGIALAKHFASFFGSDPTDPLPMTQPPSTTQIDPTDGIDPKVPPRVYISHTQVNTQLSLLSYNWTYADGDNQVTSIADAVHPLQATTIPQLTYESMPATILFEAVPQKIVVRCWDAKYQGNEAGYNLHEVIPISEAHGGHCDIVLKPGSYIYEVAAEWTDVNGSSGKASYVFAATVSNDGPATRDVTISSGDATIRTQHEFFCYGSFCAGDGIMSADGIGARRSLNLNSNETDISAIPILPLDQEVSFQLAEHGTLQRVEVFSQNANGEFVLLEDFAGTVEALSELPLGRWFVAFNVEWTDTCIHGDRETRCYDHLFILEVDHESYTSRDITIYSGVIPFTLAIECLHWSETYDSAAGTWQQTESGGAYGYLTTPSDTSIPRIMLGGDITVDLSRNGNFNGVTVYYHTESGQIVPKEDFPGTLEALSDLPEGNWYVIISVTWLSRYIRVEERYEQECYEYLFHLDNTGSDPSKVISGTCGENATWELDLTTGTLTISGSGEMETSVLAPWYSYKDQITTLIIEDGITCIGCFSRLENLVDVNIPNSVTHIGENAFSGCSSLTSIVIPNSVTHIGYSAFWHSGLTNICLPDSVTSIDVAAFSGCSALTSIVIPNSVTHIGNSAFHDCSGLTKISLPDSVTSIGHNTFAYCSSLTSISIPNGVTSIGEYTFHGCSSLTSIFIPNSVTSIGDGAFYHCSSLTSIVIPSSVTYIGNSAFCCSGLTCISIPDSVTRIDEWVFSECTSLTSITIPDSVTSIGRSAFYDCTSLTSIHFAGDLPKFGKEAFSENPNHFVTIYYPADNETWTQEAIDKLLQIYGDLLQFIPVDENGQPVNP